MTKSFKPDFVHGLSDSSRHTADMAVLAIGDNAELFKEVYDIAINSKYPLCMRAARVVQLCCQQNYHFIIPYLDDLINVISNHEIEGVKRNFLKIICDCLDLKHFSDIGSLTQICFAYIADTKQNPAIRVLAMQIALKVSLVYSELQYELIEILSIEQNSPNISVRHKAVELLKKLMEQQLCTKKALSNYL